jgi:hypothetical protein
MIEVWAWCTYRQTDVVAPEILATYLEVSPEEVTTLLVTADLGEKVKGGVRIKGCQGRIDWYGKIKAGAKKGGRARVASAKRGKGGKFLKVDQAPSSPELDRPGDGPPAPSRPTTTTTTTATTTATTKKRVTRKKKPSVNPSFTRIRKKYFELFDTAYSSTPMWSGKEAKALSSLLADFTEDQVTRRLACLYEQPPDYLKPPFTIMTLRGNFDQCIPVAKRPNPNNVTADDFRALAEVAAREEETR